MSSHTQDHSGHSHHSPHHPQGGRALAVVIAMTTTIFLAELIGGLVSGSLALLADAGHMLSDSAGLVLAAVALLVGRKPANRKSTFGYRRAEVLSALVNAIAVALIAIWILIEAIRRVGSDVAIDTGLMMIVATIGLLANLISAAMLHRAAGESMNIRGAYLHVLVDLFGSVAVLVAGGIIYATGWVLADTIASVLIVALVLPRAWQLLKQAGAVLMEQVPGGIDISDIQQRIEALDGVKQVHDLHVWTIDGEELIATLHVVRDASDPNAAGSEADCHVLDDVQRALREHEGITHSTVQIEQPGHSEHEPGICAPEH